MWGMKDAGERRRWHTVTEVHTVSSSNDKIQRTLHIKSLPANWSPRCSYSPTGKDRKIVQFLNILNL